MISIKHTTSDCWRANLICGYKIINPLGEEDGTWWRRGQRIGGNKIVLAILLNIFAGKTEGVALVIVLVVNVAGDWIGPSCGRTDDGNRLNDRSGGLVHAGDGGAVVIDGVSTICKVKSVGSKHPSVTM